MIIGVEGPAGSGKSTMARKVASELGATVLEGGVWYRALTYIALKKGINAGDTKSLVEEAGKLNVEIAPQHKDKSRILLNGEDVTKALYQEHISVATPQIAQQIPVREVIEKKIIEFAGSRDMTIFVGRHTRRIFPGAAVLRLEIDEAEADRRHVIRAGEAAKSVAERNKMDKLTAKLLGHSSEGVTTVDVTTMTKEDQAGLLRQFIARHS